MLRNRTLPCPGRFQRCDFDFVAEVLSPEGARCHLEKLWSDPDGLREMLDLREVLRALLESPALLRVTPGFYFYVLVRHGFVRAGLEDVELADYIAGVLTKRVTAASGDPLLNSLFQQGLARPDALDLGLEVDSASRICGADRAWAVGPLTKGRFWEITAVPDIRGQVAQVAYDIAKEMNDAVQS